MDYSSLIQQRRERFAEVEQLITDPDLFSDPKRGKSVMSEHSRLKGLLEMWETLETAKTNLEENRELAKEDDPEIAEMAEMEIPELESTIETLSQDVQYALLPRDEAEDRDALLEIRSGAGGDEAAIFAGELMRMYQRYSEQRNWKHEHLDSTPSEAGGFSKIVIKVTGEEVFRFLKYESGVHRVQRVPATETQGRIHTSAATVAVLPEAEEVDIEIKESDLRIDVFRASGPGGQSVNTTDSAVRIVHEPTGITVQQQDEKSQHKNRAKAMRVLRSRLYEAERAKVDAERSASRKGQVGSGDRSERIRTYNFPQGRITDHRINLTMYSIEKFMEGDIDEMVNALTAEDQAQKMAEFGE